MSDKRKGNRMDTMSKTQVTRRGFVQAGGIAAAGALGASAAGAQEAAGEEAWDEEADVVVIGYGIAGIAAAKAAADAGATAIVLEKAPEDRAGGATRVNGGTFALLGDIAYLNGSYGAVDQALIDRMREVDPGFRSWVTDELGIGLINDLLLDGGGRAFWEAADQALRATEGVEVLFETPATKILKGADGQVHGVESAPEGGQARRFKARKGVIVCSGSYVGNKDLVWGTHYPYLPYELATSPYNTGDGVFLVADAGGAVMKDTAHAIEFFGWAMEPASREVGTAMLQDDMNWRQNDFTQARIFVNKDGRRFMAEDVADTHDRTTYPFLDWTGIPANAYKGGEGNGYDNLPMWAVLDSKIVDQGSLWSDVDWQPAHVYGVGEWSEDNQAEVEKGWLLKADTIEELAAQMTSADPVTGEPVSVDAEGLAATVEEYNRICAEGSDPLGKDPAYLTGIDQPPYYAVELVPALGYTNSGVPSNDDSQVLTWGGDVVPRLYAAGDIGQGMRACMLTMGGCACRAIIGVQSILAQDAWE